MEKNLLEYMREIHDLLDSCQFMLLNEFQTLISHDITTKQWILISLLHKRGRLNVSEIAQHLEVTPSAISQLMRKLEKEEYIKRSVNPENRRETFVSLHTKGEQLINDQINLENMMVEKYYSKLAHEEIVQFHQIIHKLHQVISQEKRK